MKVRNRILLFLLATAVILRAGPLRASVDVGELERAISLSRDALTLQQNEEGYWFNYVETNTFYNSLQILLYYYLGKEEEERRTIEGLCNYLLYTQSEDGSWPLFEGGPPDLGLTTLNYFALKLSGYHEDAPPLVLARAYVLSHGGAGAINELYRAILALFDQFVFPPVPEVPIPLLLCLSPQLSWVRIILIPLIVVLNEGAFFQPPMEAYITELFLYPPKGRIIPQEAGLLSVIDATAEEARKEFRGTPLSSSLAVSDSYTEYVDWLLARQNATNGLFYDYMPNTFFPLLSLKAIEDTINNEEAMNKALQGLRSLQLDLPEGIYQNPSDSTVMDTGLTVWALLQAGLSFENPVIQKGVDFLWSRQHSKPGDWVDQTSVPVSPGGWGFSLHSERYPDTDDSAMTLLVLRDLYGDGWDERIDDFTRGLDWLLAMQNGDGGWGTWDRQKGLLSVAINDLMKQVVGPVVLSESVVDHTTRVLLTLGRFGYTQAGNLPVGRAVNWTKAQRLEDGSWRGTWGVDFLYQTAFVMGGLSQVKAQMSDDFVQASLDYILEKQREDGGWGESPLSFSYGYYVPLEYSSPSQTAMILFGLFKFLRGRNYQSIDQLWAPIDHAINFLLSTQGQDGFWKDPTYVAVVFPGIQYARYPLFQESIILGTLGMYSQDIEHFQACSRNDPEICDGQGFDEDCDGRIDCDDPDCLDDPSCDVYTGTANAEAAALGSSFLTGSGVSNELLLFLIPFGTIIVLMILRRKRTEKKGTDLFS